MAGKGRRAAARQGELSRRRKRTQRGPSGVPLQQNAAPTAVADEAAEATAVATQAGSQAVASAATAAVRQPLSAAAPQRPQGRLRGERPAAYNYVGAELRRIGVLSSAVIVALVVLAVVL